MLILQSSNTWPSIQQSWPKLWIITSWTWWMRVYSGMWIVVELRQRLVETWTEFQRSIVGEAIEQWRNRVRSCVHAEGRHALPTLFIRSDLPDSCIVTVVIHFVQYGNNLNIQKHIWITLLKMTLFVCLFVSVISAQWLQLKQYKYNMKQLTHGQLCIE